MRHQQLRSILNELTSLISNEKRSTREAIFEHLLHPEQFSAISELLKNVKNEKIAPLIQQIITLLTDEFNNDFFSYRFGNNFHDEIRTYLTINNFKIQLGYVALYYSDSYLLGQAADIDAKKRIFNLAYNALSLAENLHAGRTVAAKLISKITENNLLNVLTRLREVLEKEFQSDPTRYTETNAFYDTYMNFWHDFAILRDSAILDHIQIDLEQRSTNVNNQTLVLKTKYGANSIEYFIKLAELFYEDYNISPFDTPIKQIVDVNFKKQATLLAADEKKTILELIIKALKDAILQFQATHQSCGAELYPTLHLLITNVQDNFYSFYELYGSLLSLGELRDHLGYLEALDFQLKIQDVAAESKDMVQYLHGAVTQGSFAAGESDPDIVKMVLPKHYEMASRMQLKRKPINKYLKHDIRLYLHTCQFDQALALYNEFHEPSAFSINFPRMGEVKNIFYIVSSFGFISIKDNDYWRTLNYLNYISFAINKLKLIESKDLPTDLSEKMEAFVHMEEVFIKLWQMAHHSEPFQTLVVRLNFFGDIIKDAESQYYAKAIERKYLMYALKIFWSLRGHGIDQFIRQVHADYFNECLTPEERAKVAEKAKEQYTSYDVLYGTDGITDILLNKIGALDKVIEVLKSNLFGLQIQQQQLQQAQLLEQQAQIAASNQHTQELFAELERAERKKAAAEAKAIKNIKDKVKDQLKKQKEKEKEVAERKHEEKTDQPDRLFQPKQQRPASAEHLQYYHVFLLRHPVDQSTPMPIDMAIEKYKSIVELYETDPMGGHAFDYFYIAASFIALSESFCMMAQDSVTPDTYGDDEKLTHFSEIIDQYEIAIKYAQKAYNCFKRHAKGDSDESQADYAQLSEQISSTLYVAMSKAKSMQQRFDSMKLALKAAEAQYFTDRDDAIARMGGMEAWCSNPNPSNKHREAQKSRAVFIEHCDRKAKRLEKLITQKLEPYQASFGYLAGKIAHPLLGDGRNLDGNPVVKSALLGRGTFSERLNLVDRSKQELAGMLMIENVVEKTVEVNEQLRLM